MLHVRDTLLRQLQGVMVSFAEASSYVIFALEVSPLLPVHVLIPLLSAVYAVRLSHDQWEQYKVIITSLLIGCYFVY